MKKNTGAEAIRPSYIGSIPLTEDVATGAPIIDIGDEERSLEALSRHSGWIVLKSYIERLLKELDEITDAGMTQGLSLEEIGRNALVANIAKGMIRRIIEKVQDATEAIERENGLTK